MNTMVPTSLLPSRRPAAAIALGWAALLVGEPAGAEPASALDRFEPAAATSPFFAVPSATIEGDLRPFGGATFALATEPLGVTTDAGASRTVIDHQGILHLGAGVELARAALLEAAWPVILTQTGAGSPITPAPGAATTVGDVRVGGKLALLEARGAWPGAALGLDVWLPTGDGDAYASAGVLRIAPRVVLGSDGERAAWSFTAAPRWQPRVAGSLSRSELELGAAAGPRFGPVWVGPEVVVQIGLEAPPDDVGNVAAEARLGAKLTTGPLVAGLAAGPGIGELHGTPSFRVIASIGIALETGAPEAGAPEAGAPEEQRPGVDRAGGAVAPDRANAAPAPGVADPGPRPGPTAAPVTPGGAAPVAPAVAVGGAQLLLLRPVQFAVGSEQLAPESDQVLIDVARALAEHPEIARLAVDGHTDGDGDDARNLRLSQRRALAVVTRLVDLGVDARRLEARGFGERSPVADGSTPEGRSRNRRVELVVRKRTELGKDGWVDGPIE